LPFFWNRSSDLTRRKSDSKIFSDLYGEPVLLFNNPRSTSGISPEMAVRLSKVFGGSAATWLTQQAHYELAHVRADRIKLNRMPDISSACPLMTRCSATVSFRISFSVFILRSFRFCMSDGLQNKLDWRPSRHCR
jgi:hypothetical protein